MTGDYDFAGTASGVSARFHCRGLAVLNNPAINRGTAFTPRERDVLGLTGLLPAQVTTLESQVRLAHREYSEQLDDRDKWAYLCRLRADNEVLFYRLVTERLTEILPILEAPFADPPNGRPRSYSQVPQGVYLSIDHPEDMRLALLNTGVGPNDIDILVASDSGDWGIGDQGAGAIDSAVGRLAVYTAAAGMNPGRTLAVVLDAGTDNLSLLNDDSYWGARHSRVRDQRYDEFIDAFLAAVGDLFPDAVLHCTGLTFRGDHKVRTFSETQGTAAVALAAVISGVRATGSQIGDQSVVIYGDNGPLSDAITDLLQLCMIEQGLSPQEADGRVHTVGAHKSSQLVNKSVRQDTGVPPPNANDVPHRMDRAQLADLLDRVQPTVVVDTSATAEACTEALARQLVALTPRPIVVAPSQSSRLPKSLGHDLSNWTGGRALIAVGRPGPAVHHDRGHGFAEVTGALIYPGIGLGVIVAQATKISNRMIAAAAAAVARMVETTKSSTLLPSLTHLRHTSAAVAVAVATAARDEGLAPVAVREPIEQVHNAMWRPDYPVIALDSF